MDEKERFLNSVVEEERDQVDLDISLNLVTEDGEVYITDERCAEDKQRRNRFLSDELLDFLTEEEVPLQRPKFSIEFKKTREKDGVDIYKVHLPLKKYRR